MLTSPHKDGVLLQKRSKRFGNDNKVFNNFPIVPSQSQETPNFFDIGWLRPREDSFYLGRICGNASRRNDVP
jgi:hypothetical protein